MSEWPQVWQAGAAWYAAATFSLLYAVGGRGPKWVRRFVGGLLIAGATVSLAWWNHTFHWAQLILLVTLPASLTLGYGGGEEEGDLGRRALYGAVVSANAWVLAFGGALWIVALFQQLLGIAASVVFGLTNPFRSAAKEEAAIGGLGVILLPLMT